VVFATQNADPSLSFGTGDPHPTGVGYATSPSDTEYVFKEDGASMPTSTLTSTCSYSPVEAEPGQTPDVVTIDDVREVASQLPRSPCGGR
jgi:hypothetical protein